LKNVNGQKNRESIDVTNAQDRIRNKESESVLQERDREKERRRDSEKELEIYDTT